MSRTTIPQKTLKVLFARSENRCASLGMLPYRSEDETEELFLNVKTRREKAERKDDVNLEGVNAMSYNKASKTPGAVERWRISPLQKFFGWWLPTPCTMNTSRE